MATKHAAQRVWAVAPSADGRRWSAWPAGDKPGSWEPPYGLPAVGGIVHAQVSSNTFNLVKPGGESDAGWNHVNLEVWGGGVFVPWYGALGAYFIGGANGGHNNGCNYYGAVWPVETGEWALLAPTNTGIRDLFGYGAGTNDTTAQTNGADYYELNSTTPSASVPAAAHPYRNQVPWNLGDDGSVLWVGRASACQESVSVQAAHQIALGASSITYSRHSSNLGTRAAFDNATAVIGEYVYLIHTSNNSHRQLQRYQPSTGAWDLFPGTIFDLPPSNCTGNGFAFAHLDRYIVKRGNASELFIFDTQTPANGWVTLTTSGTMPASVVDVPAKVGSNYYWVPIGGGTGLTKLVPPADPVNGTWAFSTATMTTGSFPAHPAVGQAGAMYTATFALTINSVDYLGHCVGGPYGMHLCRPE